MRNLIRARIEESVAVKEAMLADGGLLGELERLAEAAADAIRSGGKLLLCGNGGSASDALHIAGELVGRFQRERGAWPAIALGAEAAAMTAIANDYGYEEVFARQTSAHMRPGDLLIALSTSGGSENVLRAVRTAKELGGKTAAFTGGGGGRLGAMADFTLAAPSSVTARVQECHILLGHILCELVEDALTEGAPR